MNNPIPKSNMWHTHTTLESLLEHVQASSGCDKEVSLIMTGVMLALNTAHHLVEQELK